MLEYAELGMEAVWKIEVEDFPAFIVVDDKGNDFFTDPSGAVTVPAHRGDPGALGASSRAAPSTASCVVATVGPAGTDVVVHDG